MKFVEEKKVLPDSNVIAPAVPDYVVLLHGLGRTRRAMRPLEKHLGAEGYKVVNIGYPSRRYQLETLAQMVRREIGFRCPDRSRRIHFVTHSLGGIILRRIMLDDPLPNLGRVVMLAPPNSGSEAADLLGRSRIFRRIFGPVLGQLGTSPDTPPNRLGPVSFSPGVIAGSRSLMPWFGPLFRDDYDGLVAVERTKIEGMADFIVVPASHSFIMRNRQVARQAAHFLRHGQFDK